MQLTPMILLVALALGACGSDGGASSAGSSSNPSAQSTYDRFVSTYCQALVACCSSGQLACAGDFTQSKCESAFSKDVGAGTETCTSDQVNACLGDIKNQSCTALNPSTLTVPSSCNGC